MEELEVLRLVARRLAEAKIAYMVTGSMAMAFYVQPRMTRDIDLVVELAEPDLAAMVRLFAADFLMDESGMRRAVREHGMFNLIHSDAVVKVDCMVRKEGRYRQEEFRRRRRLAFHGEEIWVVSPEDLILSKLAWARDSQSEQQRRDVRTLLAGTALDQAYLERWAAELGVADALREAGRA